MPAEASAHPGICRAGSDIVEWLIQKYSIAEDGKGSSVLFLRPTRPWSRGQAHWLLPPLRIHRLASQRPCTWAASSCSTATSTRCATRAASSSGPMRRPIDSRSAWTGSRWGAPPPTVAAPPTLSGTPGRGGAVVGAALQVWWSAGHSPKGLDWKCPHDRKTRSRGGTFSRAP